jgi:hypothetical protein
MWFGVSFNSSDYDLICSHSEQWQAYCKKERTVDISNEACCKLFFLWFYSRVPALTASVMIFHLSLSIAILFKMPTPMFLRSSMLSSHLIGGRPTLLVPYIVANV